MGGLFTNKGSFHSASTEEDQELRVQWGLDIYLGLGRVAVIFPKWRASDATLSEPQFPHPENR